MNNTKPSTVKFIPDALLPKIMYKVLIDFLLKQEDFIDISSLDWNQTFHSSFEEILKNYSFVFRAVHLFIPNAGVYKGNDKLVTIDSLKSYLLYIDDGGEITKFNEYLLTNRSRVQELIQIPKNFSAILNLFIAQPERLERILDILIHTIYEEETIQISYSKWIENFKCDKISTELIIGIISFGSELNRYSLNNDLVLEKERFELAITSWTKFASIVVDKITKFLPVNTKKLFLYYVLDCLEQYLFKAVNTKYQKRSSIYLTLRKIKKFITPLKNYLDATPPFSSLLRFLLEMPVRIKSREVFINVRQFLFDLLTESQLEISVDKELIKYRENLTGAKFDTLVYEFYEQLDRKTSKFYIKNEINEYELTENFHRSWYFMKCLMDCEAKDITEYPIINYTESFNSESKLFSRKIVNLKAVYLCERIENDAELCLSRNLLINLIGFKEKIQRSNMHINDLRSSIIASIIAICVNISFDSFNQYSSLSCGTLIKLISKKFSIFDEVSFDKDFVQFITSRLPYLEILFNSELQLEREKRGKNFEISMLIIEKTTEIIQEEDFFHRFFEFVQNSSFFDGSLIDAFLELGKFEIQISTELVPLIIIQILVSQNFNNKEIDTLTNQLNQTITECLKNPINGLVIINSLISCQLCYQNFTKSTKKSSYCPILNIDWINLAIICRQLSKEIEERFCLEFYWLNFDHNVDKLLRDEECRFIVEFSDFCLRYNEMDEYVAIQIHALNSIIPKQLRARLILDKSMSLCADRKLKKLCDWQTMKTPSMQKNKLKKINYNTEVFIEDIAIINDAKLYDLNLSKILIQAKGDLFDDHFSMETFEIFKYINKINCSLENGEKLLWISREIMNSPMEDSQKMTLSTFAFNLSITCNNSSYISQLLTAQELKKTNNHLSNFQIDIEKLSDEYQKMYFDLIHMTDNASAICNVQHSTALMSSHLDQFVQQFSSLIRIKEPQPELKGIIIEKLSLNLKKLVEQLDNNQLKNLDDIVTDVIVPNMQKIISWSKEDEQSNKIQRSVALNWMILSEFADRNYQKYLKYLSSTDFIHREKLLESTNDNLKIFDEFEKTNNSVIKKFLTKQSQIENEEIAELKKKKAEFYELTMRAHCECLIMSKEYSMKSYKFIYYWLFQSEKDSNFLVDKYLNKIPTESLLNLFPQILGKLCSLDEKKKDSLTSTQLETLLVRIILEFPYETIYTLVSTIYSDWDRNLQNPAAKKSIFKKAFNPSVEEKSIKAMKAESLFKQVLDKCKDDDLKVRLKDVTYLCKAYYELAILDVSNQMKASKSLRLEPSLLLMQFQKNDNFKRLPVISLMVKSKDVRSKSAILNEKFDSSYQVLTGISQPKLIRILSSDGRWRKQLLKGRDDPKQDAVMQQIFSVTNKVLKSNKSLSADSLITTYKVVALSSRSAVIEFVEDTLTLSEYLANPQNGAHYKYRPNDLTPVDARKMLIKNQMENATKKLKIYKEICTKLKPVLGYLFTEQFSSPESCFIAKKIFSQSLSVSSIIGYVLGLGDRHPSNILIRTSSASLVHIDLGIAFEQGRYLACPEIVPFRLTRDFVHALGPYGLSTKFTKYGKLALQSLMNHKEVVETLLQTFLHDPLFHWCLTPDQLVQFEKKRQKFTIQNNSDISFNMSLSAKSNQNESKPDGTNFATEITQQMAIKVIDKVRRKLQGYDHSGHGSISQNNGYSLDAIIENQVSIATSQNNLSRMFNGWQAYL